MQGVDGASEDRSGHWSGGFEAQKRKKAPYVFDEAKSIPLESGKAETEATPRTKFLDTAFWSPAVVTDAQGNASVEVTLPDNLTRWRAATVGNTREAQVGTAETNITVKKDLLVRLEAPRYFVERDSMTVSGIVQNSTDSPQTVTVNLNLGGESLAFETPADRQNASPTPNAPRQTPNSVEVEVPANGEKRVDWRVAVRHPGVATLRLSANSQTMRDATELSFPVLIHGIERAVTVGGVLQKERQASVSIELPEARKPGTSEVVVHLTPSIASVMLDALPYLNDYPYGCVEQTMSRFLPTVLTAATLSQQGVKLEDLRMRMEKIAAEAKRGRGALKVDDSPYSYSKLKPGTEAPPLETWKSPVFNSKEQAKMLSAGLSRLRDFQHADGGWGWWKEGESDPYMSAYVLYGLQLSSAAGHPIGNGRLERGLNYLLTHFNAETDVHQLAYEARVLAMSANMRDAIRKKSTGKLFEKRESLSSYSKGQLALALNSLGEKEKASVVLRNLEDKLKTDAENGTAHWEEPNRYWWRWYNNSTETNATILQAILAIQPDSKLAPMLVKWLVNRRSGSHWETTRETALTVYALSDYIRVKKELSPNYTLTVALGDKIKRTYKVTPENALVFDNRFVVPDALLSTGKQTITISKEGEGACYFSATTRYFSQEEPIKASGNEVFVTRNYFKLLAGTAAGEEVSTTLDPFRPNPFLTEKVHLLDVGEQIVNDNNAEEGPRYERAALKEGETVASGDLLEAELQIDSKNDYEYLVFEDIKPAGCEPVEVRSGGNYSSGLYSNKELRDQKVAFFVTSLPQGRRTLSYRLRAEVPGVFHVLPTNGYAMYAPDVRANSDERTLRVRDE